METVKTKVGRPKAETTSNSNPNKDLTELNDIDYQNLTGETFNKYQEIFGALFLNEKYDFEMWLATGTTKKKFNEDTGVVDTVMNGIKLNGNKPIQITRISIKGAIDLNAQVVLSQNGTLGYTNSKYYLLCKPKSE